MKFSSVVLSFLLSLGTVASKKHGLRALMQVHKESEVESIRAECMEYFTEMDLDEDNVLSLQDLKGVVAFLINKDGADEAQVRKFAEDLSSTDVNDDGQIEILEFMNACAVVDSASSDPGPALNKQALKDGLLMRANKNKKAVPMRANKNKEAVPMRANKNKEAVPMRANKNIEAVREQHDDAHKAARKVVHECSEYFTELDLDEDNVLSFEDLEPVMKALINDDVDEAEVRQFANDLSGTDVDNDGLIQMREFMNACTQDVASAPAQVDSATSTVTQNKSLKDALLKRAAAKEEVKVKKEAEAKEEAKAKKAELDQKRQNIEECKGYFRKMDIDSNGTLSLHDLKIVIDSKVAEGTDESELQDFVSDLGDLDVNNDDTIDMNEFMQACILN